MQEQKTVIPSIHNQNSSSIPVCCSALRYENNEAVDSALQIISSHDQMNNEISGVVPVYSLVTCVSLMNYVGCMAIFLMV